MTFSVSARTDSHGSSSIHQHLGERMNAFRVERWQTEWKGRHIMRGRAPSQSSVRLISNDYLSIANHPEIVEAQIKALRGWATVY